MDNKNLTIEDRVKDMIIRRLELEVTPEDIKEEAPLFGINDNGEGLGIDSVDALEIIVGLKEEFGVKNNSEDNTYLYSVKTISDFVKVQSGLM